MRSTIAPALALLAALSAVPARSATPRYEPAAPNVQADALSLLDAGATYLEGVDLPGETAGPSAPFEEIDAPLAAFLEYPNMQPAVQFSCAVMATPGEARLAKALEAKDDARALLALASLMHVHSPSTVQAQHDALTRLRARRPKWKATLARLSARFSPKALTRALAEDPPADDRYGDAPTLEWTIRAVGVRKQKSALPRLATLCVSDHLHTSLAAERSIEDFTGPQALSALAACVEGWQYDAADRALGTLRERDPDLARRALETMPIPPADSLYRYDNALRSVAAPSTVPRLVAILPDLERPSAAIDALEDHARPEHADAIEALIPKLDATHEERLRALVQQLRD
ncbi:MAG: hypothetical protein ACE37F_07615 [Nannocystaceae bacterium]|nr:hypothetical protein [bacterium]